MFISDVKQWAAMCVNQPERIAEALQRLGRFGGQHPTSNVLWHSLEVAWMCRTMTTDAQIWALFHDAHEVLSGEVTRPFKTIDLQLKQQEADEELMRAFDLRIGRAEWKQIQSADTLCGDYEHKHWAAYHWQFRECEWWAQYRPLTHVDLFVEHAQELRRRQKEEANS